MTDKPGEWEEDNVPTNETCPNGHPTQIRMNKAAGQGRVFCGTPGCDWNDSQPSVLAGKGLGQQGVSKPGGRRAGVRVMTSHGDSAEGREGVTTLGGRRGPIN